MYPSYATADNVQDFLATFIQGVNSIPSVVRIGNLLSYTAGEIDASLKHRGLATPVTMPAEFVEELTELNAMGAAAWVAQQAFPETMGPSGTPIGKQLLGDFQARLTEYRSGIGIPVGVAVFENDLQPRTWITDQQAWGVPNGTAIDPFGDPINGEPIFTIAKRW